MTTERDLDFAALTTQADYNYDAKNNFHSTVAKYLSKLARRFDATGMYGQRAPIRHNKGGIAVSGEVILHYERLYVQVSQSMLGFERGIMYRSCNGLDDYHGGPNHFTNIVDLLHTDRLARTIERNIARYSNLSARKGG